MNAMRFLTAMAVLCVLAILAEHIEVSKSRSIPKQTEMTPAMNTPRASDRPEPNGSALEVNRAFPGASSQDQIPTFAEAIEKVLDSEDSPERDQELTRLFQEWVAHDPLTAASFAQGIASPELREKARRLVLQTWTTLDSSAALSWVAKLATPYEHQTAMDQVFTQMLERDPQGAMQTAISHLDEAQNDLLGHLIQKWTAQDFSAAHDWVKQQPSGEQRDGLLAHMAFEQSKTSPMDAARLVSQEISPGDTQIEAAIWVLDQWALSDPKGASAWLDQFPEGATRVRAQDELSRSINND